MAKNKNKTKMKPVEFVTCTQAELERDFPFTAAIVACVEKAKAEVKARMAAEGKLAG